MIVDAQHDDVIDKIHYDVCIVGAGAAGISVALELIAAGRRVCLLEAGGLDYETDVQKLLDGDVVGYARYPDLRDTRLSAFGGSTGVWAGWCRPLDRVDFLEDPDRNMPGWPITLDELMPFYRRAQELCGLGPFHYEPEQLRSVLMGEPILLNGAFSEKIVHVHAQRFGDKYRQQIERSSDVVVLLHATALRARMVNRNVESLEICARGGRQFDLAAHAYVFAGGGIENARLLLLSGSSTDCAPGNDAGMVGRFFADHPFVEVGTLVTCRKSDSLRRYFPHALSERSKTPSLRAVMSLREDVVMREHLPNGGLFFHPPYASHGVYRSREVRAFLELWNKFHGKAVPGNWLPYLSLAARAPHRVAMAAMRKLLIKGSKNTRWHVRMMFEPEFRHENRVSLGTARDALGRPKTRVEWALSDRDLAGMSRITELFEETMSQASNACFERAFPDNPSAWREAAESGKHHMGTTRMHRDHRYGVVDQNSRVHGTSNLYVTGSSVFPSGGWANPTLTIVALAVRLAKHLARS